MGPSRTYEAEELGELITDYLKEDDSAGLQLRNKVITGEELLDGLSNVYYDSKEKERSEKLVKGLEGIIQGRDGLFVNKIREVIEEYSDPKTEKPIEKPANNSSKTQ